MDEVKLLYVEAEHKYESLKKDTESSVKDFKYATGPYYELNPAYHKMNGLSKGKLIKTKPSNLKGLYEFGFDEDKKLILCRQYNDFGYYESFFVYSDESVVSYLYDYTAEKTVINVQKYNYVDNLLMRINKKAVRGNSVMIFHYENKQISRIEQYYGDSVELNNYRFYNLFHDKKGKISEIMLIAPKPDSVPYTRIVYKKSNNIRKIEDKITKQMITIIINYLINNDTKDEIYTIGLLYSNASTNILPPSIGLLSKTERTAMIDSHVDSRWNIWNPAEYNNLVDLIDYSDSSLKALFDEMNSFIVETDSYNLVLKILNNVCVGIREELTNSMSNLSKDFIVFSTDTELTQAYDSIKYVNPLSLVEKLTQIGIIDKRWYR